MNKTSNRPLYALLLIAVLVIVSYALFVREALFVASAASHDQPFVYPFTTPSILDESDSPQTSASKYWWLNSGGRLIVTEEYGETIQGPLSPTDPWRLEYLVDNPADTGNGFFPQTLFRLVSRSTWGDVRAEAHFYIVSDDPVQSPNRNESNGILLMSRYSPQGQTLYYGGLRVDGTAIIKKKYRGEYSTLAQIPAFPGTYAGSATDLLPHRTWIGLRMDTRTIQGVVSIRLYKQNDDGSWQQILATTDDGTLGGKPILQSGPVGIRTDFMDVRFKDFRAEAL